MLLSLKPGASTAEAKERVDLTGRLTVFTFLQIDSNSVNLKIKGLF